MEDIFDSKQIKIFRRHTMMLDIPVLVFSYAMALALRYYVLDFLYRKAPVMSGMYVSIFLILIGLHVLITLAKSDKWSVPPDQTKVEVVVTVLKMQTYLLIGILVYLFAARLTSSVSRSVLGMFFIINLLLESIVRLWYRKRIIRRNRELMRGRKYLLIAEDDQLELASLWLWHRNPHLNLELVAYSKVLECIRAGKNLVESGSYLKAYVFLPDVRQTEIIEVLKLMEKSNIKSDVILTMDGDRIGRSNIASTLGFQAVKYTGMLRKGWVLGVRYTISTIHEAVFYVRKHLKELEGQYICFSNVHTTVMSYDRSDVRDAENSAALTFPDGAPIARILRHESDVNAKRVAGPDFMDQMLTASMDGRTTHFFYGSTEETLSELKRNIEKRYPGAVVKGYYSPPFRQLTPEEEQENIDMINRADADIIWIGLGAPKQELWMQAHKGQFRGVMVGVGAAFDFHAGTIRRAPLWMQLISLEWLYRLFQDPGKLLKRYLITNIRFLWLIATGRNNQYNEKK